MHRDTGSAKGMLATLSSLDLGQDSQSSQADHSTTSVTYPPILISSAEGSKLLTDYPPLNTCGIKFNLPTADVLFYGNGPDPTHPIPIALEVKSIADLCQSRDNGRLFAEQLPKMLDAHGHAQGGVCRLLVYGIVRCSPRDNSTLQELIEFTDQRTGSLAKRWADCKLGPKRRVPYTYLVSTLDKAARLGCPAIQVQDLAHAALWIGALARSYAKPYDQQTDAFRAFNESASTPPPRFHLYDSVTKYIAEHAKVEDGIGWDRAYALASHFPSLLALVNASPEEIAEVRTVAASGRETRIGPVIARSIYEAIRRKRPGC